MQIVSFDINGSLSSRLEQANNVLARYKRDDIIESTVSYVVLPQITFVLRHVVRFYLKGVR